MSASCAAGDSDIQVKGPQLEPGPTSAELREEIRKYLKLLPEVPEPNLARVREIKEQVQQGTYVITREMIEETATRLVLRFLRRE